MTALTELEADGRVERGQLVLDRQPALPEGALVHVRITVKEVDENGWPIGFFERFVGCIDDPTFERPPQGEYEVREGLE